MRNTSEASQLLWEEQQAAFKVQADLDRRAWQKNGALLFALVMIILAITAVLARWPAVQTLHL